MASDNEYKQHISITERLKWNKVCSDFQAHVSSSGEGAHKKADGTVPGFSTCDFTSEEKAKLAGIQAGALNNPHPSTHPYTMIEGLSQIAHTGSYKDLTDVPTEFYCNGGDADTVGGIRICISSSSPSNPVNDKVVWFDTSTMLIKVYHNDAWASFSSVFSA